MNVEAVAAVACGIAAYYAVPQSWLKVAWGAGAAAVTYVALTGVLRRRASRPARMPWMRAPSSRRAVLVAACAVVAAGVATAVVLVATAHSSAEPTRAEYLAGVAAVCRVFGPKLDVIRPPDVAEPANVIAAVDRVLPLVKAQLGRVRRLEPPPELRGKVERWLVLQQRRLGMLEKAHAAGRRQDFRALEHRLRRFRPRGAGRPGASRARSASRIRLADRGGDQRSRSGVGVDWAQAEVVYMSHPSVVTRHHRAPSAGLPPPRRGERRAG